MKKLFTTVSFLAFLGAHDNGTPGWKMDDKNAVVLKDGNPVYIDSNGREMTVGGETISNLNKEASTSRQRYETAETSLAKFQGLDPEKARTALDMVDKIDKKKLLDAGEVDKVRKEISDQFTAQLAEKDTGLKTLQSQIDGMKIDGVFANSNFVRENIAVPDDMFQATFRRNFKVEDDKITAYGKDGNRLMSKQKVGEYAEPEEALQLLVDMHPQKDTILKANVGSGSGNSGNGGNRGNGRNMKRADFEKLTPVQKLETSKKVSAGEMTLTD